MRKAYFRQGQLVIAVDFTGREIIGEYRGRSPNFGCYIYGHPEHSDDPNQLHKCLTLTLKALNPTPKPPQITGKGWPKFSPGEPVSAQTSRGEAVTGWFTQSDGQHAYIKGYRSGIDKFSTQPTAIRVLRHTLKRP